jgi:hypothetical protein
MKAEMAREKGKHGMQDTYVTNASIHKLKYKNSDNLNSFK